jgi:hypothetical protein
MFHALICPDSKKTASGISPGGDSSSGYGIFFRIGTEQFIKLRIAVADFPQ